MEKIIDIAFSGFWNFCGVAFLLTLFGNFVIIIWNRFWRHWNIRKHGYPPIHCDADGDFKKDKSEAGGRADADCD